MRRLMALGAAAVVSAALFMGAPAVAAVAATPGYPPPTLGNPPPTTTLFATSITCPVGGTCTMTFSGFNPGSLAQIFIGGQLAATVTVSNTANSFTITLTVTDPHISVNGGPLIAVPFGANTVTASGTAANGQPGSVTGTVTIPTTTTSSVTGGAAGTSGAGGTSGTSSTGSGSGSSSLAFTGAEIGLMVGGGLILLAAGTGLVVATRRRSHIA